MEYFKSLYCGLYDDFRNPRVRGLLAFSLIGFATLVFWVLEDWALLDAAFFSVMTISTVGYGELVPATVAGKIFCMFYILTGLGAFVAAASAVDEALLHRREAQYHK